MIGRVLCRLLGHRWRLVSDRIRRKPGSRFAIVEACVRCNASRLLEG